MGYIRPPKHEPSDKPLYIFLIATAIVIILFTIAFVKAVC